MDGSWIWAAEYNSLIPLLPASTLSPLTLRWAVYHLLLLLSAHGHPELHWPSRAL